MLAQDFHFHSSDSLQILAIVDESLIPSLPPSSFLSLGGQNLTVKLRLASNQDLPASNLCLYFYISCPLISHAAQDLVTATFICSNANA